MINRSARRRLVDLTVAGLTWCAAIAVAMWFYDWASRWYVVVGFLLAIVAMAMVADRGKSDASAEAASALPVDVLPLQRTPEATESGWSASAEQQIA
jgi:hypothetical protein